MGEKQYLKKVMDKTFLGSKVDTNPGMKKAS